MRRQIAVLLVAVLAVPQLVSGQTLKPGARVRVSRLGEGTRTGNVVAFTTDTIEVLEAGRAESAHLSLAEVTSLEVSRGRQRHPKYALVGALAGAGLGAIAGYSSGEDDCSKKWICFNRPTLAGLGAASFGVVGGVLGLVAGVIPSESWERVSLERRVSLVTQSSSHGPGVGLRVAF